MLTVGHYTRSLFAMRDDLVATGSAMAQQTFSTLVEDILTLRDRSSVVTEETTLEPDSQVKSEIENLIRRRLRKYIDFEPEFAHVVKRKVLVDGPELHGVAVNDELWNRVVFAASDEFLEEHQNSKYLKAQYEAINTMLRRYAYHCIVNGMLKTDLKAGSYISELTSGGLSDGSAEGISRALTGIMGVINRVCTGVKEQAIGRSVGPDEYFNALIQLVSQNLEQTQRPTSGMRHELMSPLRQLGSLSDLKEWDTSLASLHIPDVIPTTAEEFEEVLKSPELRFSITGRQNPLDLVGRHSSSVTMIEQGHGSLSGASSGVHSSLAALINRRAGGVVAFGDRQISLTLASAA